MKQGRQTLMQRIGGLAGRILLAGSLTAGTGYLSGCAQGIRDSIDDTLRAPGQVLNFVVNPNAPSAREKEERERSEQGGYKGAGDEQNSNNVVEKNKRFFKRFGDCKEVEGGYMGLVLCNRLRDINQDKEIDFSTEIFGAGKEFYNLDKEIIEIVFFNCVRKSGEVFFRSWSSEGQLIGETKLAYGPGDIFGVYTSPESPKVDKNFIEMIKETNLAGNYRITATLDDGTMLSLDTQIDRVK